MNKRKENELRREKHFAASGIIGLLSIPVWGCVKSIFFVLANALDIDHYFDFLWRSRFKNLNIKYILKTVPIFSQACLKFARERKEGDPVPLAVNTLHTIEFVLFIFFLGEWVDNSFISVALTGIFWGVIFHIILDLIDAIRLKVPFGRCLSFTEYFIRRYFMKKKGQNPSDFYKWVLESILEKKEI